MHHTKTRVPVILATCMFAVLPSGRAADAIKDATYNMPPAVAAVTDVDDSMRKMETPVAAEILATFKKENPSALWVFGEDRQYSVRNNIVPAHWFADGAKPHGRFSGIARPGEFYVFQACVIAGDQVQFSTAIDLKIDLAGAKPVMVSRSPAWGGAFTFAPGTVKPLWIGIQIPKDAKPGTYEGSVAISFANTNIHAPNGPATAGNTTRKATCRLSLKVEGEAVPADGTEDAWRMARLKWLDSDIGGSDTVVTRPFTAIKVDDTARGLGILGREITLGANGIPASFISHFSGSNTRILKTGREAFSAPPAFEVIVAGKPVVFSPSSFKFTKRTPVGVEWIAENRADGLTLTVTGRMEFDGCLNLQMAVASITGDVSVDDIRFTVPWQNDTVKYAMGLGLQGGLCPPKHQWKWNVAKNQDAIWMGDVNCGAMLRFKGGNYHRPLINAYYDFLPLNLPDSWGGGGIDLIHNPGTTTLTAYSGPKTITTRTKKPPGLQFNIDWYFTPFKPLDVKNHFTDRYYHANQGKAEENTAELKKNNATILEIHHNRLCNPYINYPYNDDSFGNLAGFIKKAHADDLRVAVYYTTRELTQNLPEFFALKSMDGEIILKRREGVAWPVTNPGGPHPWLQQHVGMDIVPAWRENLKYDYKSKLDLAVITTPDSRWNNFYLEGLDYLVKKVGIDGLYIDDTALDRKSMQRARRILDADGNTGRRISMHSWNHFNGLAKWTNSSIAFMELYPYYNGLWHGEGFNANSPPEFMLIEMSGIPYGLMSEMLDHPNAWHGMVFGMRTRWPWSGDPRKQWQFELDHGIQDSEFIGWFDPACPVKTDNPAVKASVFKKDGKSIIAIASWAPAKTDVKLTIDWKAMGIAAPKNTLAAPAIEGFQPAGTHAVDAISIDPNRGWLLVVE